MKKAILKREYFDDLLGYTQVKDIGLKEESKKVYDNQWNEVVQELVQLGIASGTDEEEDNVLYKVGTEFIIADSENCPHEDLRGGIYIIPIGAKFNLSGIIVNEEDIERI